MVFTNMKRFAHFILAITLLMVSTNVFAQTNIQRKFFDNLELGKYVSKKMIASSVGVSEYNIREARVSEGILYTMDYNSYFGGQKWTTIQILAIDDKFAEISFFNVSINHNKAIYDDILDKLTQKYGTPSNLIGFDNWVDVTTQVSISLTYIEAPSSADIIFRFWTALIYTDYKLYKLGKSKALDEL